MRTEERFAAVCAISAALCGCLSSSNGGPVDAGGPDVGGSPGFDAAPLVDATSDAPGDDAAAAPCTPGGAPVTHTSNISADETWASGIHLVPSSLQIKGGARLTIGACSEVRLGPGASITATATAAGIDAQGTASAPIRFVAQQTGAPWGAIVATAPASATLRYVTLSGGGTGDHTSAPYGGASLVGLGTPPAPPVVFQAQHVVVEGSAGLGVFLRAAAFDPSSASLTVRQSGWYPIYAGAASAGSVPSGAYTGNAIDEVLLQTLGVAAYDDADALQSDVTLRDLGVPYRVGTAPSSIVVGDGVAGHPSASLTLAAGVQVLFTPQGTAGTSRILVNAQNTGGTYAAQGALVVAGTTAAPVVLDSAAAAPAAGDWEGLYFAGLVDPRTSVVSAHILHAGGASGTVGICGSTPNANNGVATCAVVIAVDTPPQGFLTSSVLEAAPCGIYRDWKTTDVDFTAANQFVGIPGCTQTSIPAANGQCVACPTSP
jgi:hypothetical protein